MGNGDIVYQYTLRNGETVEFSPEGCVQFLSPILGHIEALQSLLWDYIYRLFIEAHRLGITVRLVYYPFIAMTGKVEHGDGGFVIRNAEGKGW